MSTFRFLIFSTLLALGVAAKASSGPLTLHLEETLTAPGPFIDLVSAMGLDGDSGPPDETVLLADNFDTNSLQSGEWIVRYGVPASSLSFANGKAVLHNRPHLITAKEFAGTAHAPLRVTGEFSFQSATWPNHDFLQIATRSDGLPQGTYGEVNNGLSFEINGDDFLRVSTWRDGVSTILGHIPLEINDNESFAFEILDYGDKAAFSAWEIGGDGSTAGFMVTTDFDSGFDHIDFYNRENNRGFLDNIVISQVPEPSAFLIGLTAAVFLLRLRRPSTK